MNVTVAKVTALSNAKIEVEFENGGRENINIFQVFDLEEYKSMLSNPTYFKTVHVDSSKKLIQWEKGPKISAEDVFLQINSMKQHLFPINSKLKQPAHNSFLFKIVKFENGIDMIKNGYIYFNCVTKYSADATDAKMPNKEKNIRSIPYENNPNITLYDTDNSVRKNTYACCFALSESQYIWNKFGEENSLCLVFNYNKLYSYLQNNYLDLNYLENAKEHPCNFTINCGCVTYIDRNEAITKSGENLRNIYENAFYKDRGFKNEKEFRIALYRKCLSQTPQDYLKLDFDWEYLLSSGGLVKISSKPIFNIISKMINVFRK